MMMYLDAESHPDLFVPRGYEEHIVELGEIRMNYAVAGDPGSPALLLIPSRSESWWGYEQGLTLLAGHFQVFAVDLRGQGRYTLDIFGTDLGHFIDLVIERPTLVSGLSSGGEQWSIGDWDGMQRAIPRIMPRSTLQGLARMFPMPPGERPAGPPQNMKEYDPEWGKAFVSGAATASCDHENMISNVKVPVLFTHHFRQVDQHTGRLTGGMTDLQAQRVQELVEQAGQSVTDRSFPDVGHAMHRQDPRLFAETVTEWAVSIDAAVRR